MKENQHFRKFWLNYINKQKRQEYLRSVIRSIRVTAVAKTDDEIYILSTTKIYTYISFIFSTVPKKVELLKITKVM